MSRTHERTAVPAAAARPDTVALLGGGPPLEVLARIVPDDALALRARVRAHLARAALLLDAERVLLRAQALCALRAHEARAAADVGGWLDARVEEAVAEIVEECAAGEPMSAFAAPLGLDGRALAVACGRFAALAPEVREAFAALVLDGVQPDRAARARGLSLSELARRARAGLRPFAGSLVGPFVGSTGS